MKVIVENSEDKGWIVTCEDKYADHLTYDEMLGTFAQLTMPDNKRCLSWMKTKEQHEAMEKYFEEIRQVNSVFHVPQDQKLLAPHTNPDETF